jgi:hypothetical protein
MAAVPYLTSTQWVSYCFAAAAFDETFGGLLFALKSQRQLPFWVGRPFDTVL